MSSPQAFDALAHDYDSAFTRTAIGRLLRTRVHARLECCFNAGDHVLELGCGTGEDALYLAGRGVRVTATDASPAMLDIARAKTQGNPLVAVERLDLRDLADGVVVGARHASPLQRFSPLSEYDGAFANFGPLNVLDDWRPLARWLAARVKPGGIAGFAVMSPYCLWEVGWHGLHGDFKTATRRLRKTTTFRPEPASQPINIHYPTIRRLTRAFAPHFRRTHVSALGLFLPPSDAFGMVEGRPRLLKLLTRLEERFARFALLAPFADHYWIEFERQEEQ